MAVERANAAESRMSSLQADLAEARGVSAPEPTPERARRDPEPEDEPEERPSTPPAAEDGGSNGSSQPEGETGEEERSLRFRLARSAARKKGPIDSMWS
jgi:hypothetical protein